MKILIKSTLLSSLLITLFFAKISAQEFKPGAYPDRIILTWSADPKTTQSVTWRTDSTIKVSFGQILAENNSPNLEKPEAKEYQASTTSLKGMTYETANYHSITFTG